MNLIKKICTSILVFSMIATFTGCEETGIAEDRNRTLKIASTLQTNQQTPTDISYSLERYNLIRRAYWVNGQREKANMLPCEIEKPLGYIVLFDKGVIFNKFTVDGKVSSLNSFLTPDSEYYEKGTTWNEWIADVDGSYGENDSGIFFFTTDGRYIEWNSGYLYSDIPFEISDPVLTVKGE